MRFNQYRIRALLTVLLLMIGPMTLLAQESDVTIVGSGIATPLFESLVEASEVDLSLSIETTGTEDGFAAFCSGEATMTQSIRPMSVAEEALCNDSAVNFGEIVLGYSAIAFISHPDLDFLTCATLNEIGTVIAPSAVLNSTWGDALASSESDAEISVFIPPSDSLAYFLADGSVAGAGFRADANVIDSQSDIIEAVAENTGAIGVVDASLLTGDDDSVQVIDIRNNEIARCVEPDSASIGDGSYLLRIPLLGYINLDAVSENDDLSELLSFIVSDESSEAVINANAFPPSEFDVTTNVEIVSGEKSGRQFSRELTDFQILPTVAGTVNIGGAAAAFSLLNDAGSTFTQQYQSATINISTIGEPTGFRQLCNGEIDMVATYEPISDETQENCTAADIELIELEIGDQAAVLVANESAEYLTCLTTEDIIATWEASATDTVTTWDQVNDDFPADEFILFAGNTSNTIPNLMMQQAAGESIPLRTDTEVSTDPLFRAAATANVEASLTYMSWSQYQAVLDNDQERIQLVNIDAGDGCVTPSEESIDSGEYPLSRTLYLVISKTALERQEVQSYLWFLFQDNRFNAFAQSNFDLLSIKDLFDARDSLQSLFEEANLAALERAAEEAEATEEADAAAENGDTENSEGDEAETDGDS
jgi:phosphate transport system substrate-binding protein